MTGGDAEDSEGEEALALELELSLSDDAAPARVLAALNALRKSRQHYDTVLVAGGAEVPAHRAVLAAASPYLLEALAPPAAAAPPAYRVDDVDADALRDLVEYAYTGRLRVREPAAARRLYRAAWRLRLEPVRAHLAERLLRRVAPPDALELRALPDLAPPQLAALDAYIARHFTDICASGALAALPLLRIEMLRESSAEGGEETALAVADAALVWLRDQNAVDVDLDELCQRVHLLYVDSTGALRDCGELPAARGDAPELQEYRREAAQRGRNQRRAAPEPDVPARALPPLPLQLGARAPRGDCAVLAAQRVEGSARATRALLSLRGRLAAARVCWRDVAAGGGMARGGVLGAGAEPAESERRARLAHGRCAHGTAALAGALLVCGGYDRARVLRGAELYSPATNEWTALPDMRGARARFPVARLGDDVYALGGSDGHAELDSVDVFGGGAWRAAPRLPLALSHAAAAVDEERRELYLIGGWAGGLSLKRVLRFSAEAGAWSEAPPLGAGRSQCGAAHWAGALWALGGCDAWHCLAGTETLRLGEAGAGWAPGPALPTARRSVGAAVWRGQLVAAGGSDGAASLRRTEWLAAGAGAWRAGPALRRPRAALGLVALDDVLYAVGGFDGKEFLACVECLYEPDGEWTTLCAPPAPHAPLPAAAEREEQ
ncbi:influenza virus NS1A-binding protein homolog isoform X4 [Anticarsia gemmatalis]|uniref:influenza virus NS1A-binding protein homolog isoform X4 n=1 Tax=Anticarsia gemmatalis TaxID=129554 RepID=UPI003F773A9A